MKKMILKGIIPVNCYIISNNNKCFLIDPGFESEKLYTYIENNKLEVVGILLTHGHFDHVGGLAPFNAPIYVYEKEIEVFKSAEKSGYIPHNLKRNYNIENLNVVIFKDNHKFKLDDKEITFIHTAGHTEGGVCYFDGENLYTGDTLFKGSVGKWTFPTGNISALEKSLIKIFKTFKKPEIKIHPGHGESTTIETELKNNHFVELALKNKLAIKYS